MQDNMQITSIDLRQSEIADYYCNGESEATAMSPRKKSITHHNVK